MKPGSAAELIAAPIFWLTISIAAGALLVRMLYPRPSYPTLEADMKPLAALCSRYSIAVRWPAEGATWTAQDVRIRGVGPTRKQLEKALPELIDEMNRIPVDAVRRAGLTRIALSGAMTDGGQRVGDESFYDVIYLDCSAAWDSRRLRMSLDHALFHAIDPSDCSCHEDESWKALNHPGFHYGPTGPAALSPEIRSRKPDRGFASGYAMTSIVEDKAELFSSLMVDAPQLRSRCRHDPYLAAKVKRLKTILHRFSPSFDDRYWISRENRESYG